MARLEILVHRGCLSEQSTRMLAQEIQEALPAWQIEFHAASQETCDALGILAFPAFLLDGRILATGIPRKEWLLARLKEWERGNS